MSIFDIFPLVSFFILGLLIAGKVIILKNNNIKVSSFPKKNIFFKLILFPLYLLIVLVFALELINPVFHSSLSLLPTILSTPVSSSIFLKIAGIFLITVSLLILSKTMVDFKNSLRFGTDKNNCGELITTGIFSITRNPFFISIELYFMGTALVLSTPFFLAIALLSVICIHFYILKEEKFLTDNYGEEYTEYTKKIRRYF